MSEHEDGHDDDYLFLRFMTYDLSKTQNAPGGDNSSMLWIVYPVIAFVSAIAYVFMLLLRGRGHRIKNEDPEYFNRLTNRR